MATFPPGKSIPQAPKEPSITFTSQRSIVTLTKLLAANRGHDGKDHQFYRMLYGSLLYDHYALAYRVHRVPPGNESIAITWRFLAEEPNVARIYQAGMRYKMDGTKMEDIQFDLPIQSVSPFFHNTAPTNIVPGTHSVGTLTCLQFVEIAWVVRCNLLHGSYDPNDNGTYSVIRNTARPFAYLVWQMIRETQG